MKPKVKKLNSFYRNTNTKQINNYQLIHFNRLWKDIQRNIPYYKELIENNNIPKEILTYDDFLQIPILDRVKARENIDYYSDLTQTPDNWITTGGSTGTPLKYPVW